MQGGIMEKGTRTNGSGWWRFVVFFTAAAITVAGLAGAAAWQDSVSESRMDDSESHTATASLLQKAGSEGTAAADLLRNYVEQGDETLIPQIQTHVSAGVEKLTNALAQGGVADLNQIAVDGAGLAEGAGQIIALRQGGDVARAAAALEQMAPEFQALTLALEEAVQIELDEASSLQSSADAADSTASWLGIAAMAAGAATGLAIVVALARFVVRRRVPGAASPA